ncbi:MAG TPA: hypothetical protein VJ303_03565 [Steroidobacteraceae bacterium]|nr:hypothetical protein [Steroidobacteraceae bacterium]
MSVPREDLLQPTLTGAVRTAAPYSVQTTFLTGFFGGPFAALAILAMNSFRLRRVPRDALVWSALLVLLAIGGWLLFHSVAGAEVRAWFTDQFGNRAVRFSGQALGLAIVGVGYLLHRREQVNADLMGLTRPNGWIGGIGCIVLGMAVSVAFLTIIME